MTFRQKTPSEANVENSEEFRGMRDDGMWEGWGRGMEVAILPVISQRLCMIAD
jgi:hypothetical protein